MVCRNPRVESVLENEIQAFKKDSASRLKSRQVKEARIYKQHTQKNLLN